MYACVRVCVCECLCAFMRACMHFLAVVLKLVKIDITIIAITICHSNSSKSP